MWTRSNRRNKAHSPPEPLGNRNGRWWSAGTRPPAGSGGPPAPPACGSSCSGGWAWSGHPRDPRCFASWSSRLRFPRGLERINGGENAHNLSFIWSRGWVMVRGVSAVKCWQEERRFSHSDGGTRSRNGAPSSDWLTGCRAEELCAAD